jgi:hypothetical protein
MLYLWLLEIPKVRIIFQNYLFKADKRISHHLGPHRIFPADRIRILLPKTKKKKLIAAFWLLEITQKNKCIQNLSGGYNLNLNNIFV